MRIFLQEFASFDQYQEDSYRSEHCYCFSTLGSWSTKNISLPVREKRQQFAREEFCRLNRSWEIIKSLCQRSIIILNTMVLVCIVQLSWYLRLLFFLAIRGNFVKLVKRDNRSCARWRKNNLNSHAISLNAAREAHGMCILRGFRLQRRRALLTD